MIGRSADAFAVIEPPIAREAEWIAAMPRRVRLLGRVVRVWPFLLPYLPAVVALLVAVPVALVWPEGALVLVLAGVLLVVADLVVAVLRLAWLLMRAGEAAPADSVIFGDELRGYHWTITFFHASDRTGAVALCTEAFERAAGLTRERLGADPAFGSGLVGVPAECVTDDGVRGLLGTLGPVSAVAGTDWFLIGARGPFRRPDQDAVRPLSIIRVMLAAMIACLVAGAQIVAFRERQECCGDRPDTFLRALIWIVGHGIGRFPGPATALSQVFATLVMVAVLVMAVSIGVAVVRRMRYRQARKRLMYEAVERLAAEPTVVIFVINDVERDAVADCFLARSPESVFEVEHVGAHAVHRLGLHGGARIVLAQSEQGTVGTGSMPWTARNVIAELDPSFVVLTGVCYGLWSRELDGGTQELGDLVVCTQLRTADHRRVGTRADGSRYEILRGARPETSSVLLSQARALTLRRPGPAVHFGPVLSLNTLVDNPEERLRLRTLDEEAVAGEMELAGLYAAAAATKCDWILVKGISDWGVGKTQEQQPRAARNAAEFVADLITQIRPGGQPPAPDGAAGLSRPR